jgi:hypothetical protein
MHVLFIVGLIVNTLHIEIILFHIKDSSFTHDHS